MSVQLRVRWTRLAVRNIWKNKRRSFFTLLAIGVSLAAINVFGGFTRYISSGLVEGYVYSQALGHLTIHRSDYLQEQMQGRFGPLIGEEDVAAVEAVVDRFPEVVLTARELHFTGRIRGQSGEAPFYALGRVASRVAEINRLARGMVARLQLFDGIPLADDQPLLVGLSRGLAALLEVEQGSALEITASRGTGGRQTLEVELGGLFEPPMEGFNYRLIMVSLELAQRITDNRGVDRLTVVLERGTDIREFKGRLQEALDALGSDLEVLSLAELDPFLTRTRGMFDTIFWILYLIVLVIATTTVVNTIAMTILERRREIGTLRALGTRIWSTVEMFVIEGAMLGVLGSLLGILLTLLSWSLFKVYQPMWVPPYIGLLVPLEIELVPAYMASSTLVMTLLAAASAVLPALTAGRRAIPEALSPS